MLMVFFLFPSHRGVPGQVSPAPALSPSWFHDHLEEPQYHPCSMTNV